MRRVLVVDPRPATCLAVAAALRDYDCVVEGAATVHAGLALMRAAPPDAVIVDGGGLDLDAFMESAAADTATGGVPALVLTADPRAALHAIRHGARGCVRTPVHTGNLVAALAPHFSVQPQCQEGPADA